MAGTALRLPSIRQASEVFPERGRSKYLGRLFCQKRLQFFWRENRRHGTCKYILMVEIDGNPGM